MGARRVKFAAETVLGAADGKATARRRETRMVGWWILAVWWMVVVVVVLAGGGVSSMVPTPGDTFKVQLQVDTAPTKVGVDGGDGGGLGQMDLVGAALVEEEGRSIGAQPWVWDRDEIHDERVGLMPMQVRGVTKPVDRFTFHDAFAGIGASTLGLAQAGGKCVGAFERCERARAVYTGHQGWEPLGDMHTVTAAAWGQADVFMSGSPSGGHRAKVMGGDAREYQQELMWTQLRLVKEAAGAYKVCAFEQGLWFGREHNGAKLRHFCSDLRALGYEPTTGALFAPDFGSPGASRRLWIVAVRRDLHVRHGPIALPQRTSEHHPVGCVIQHPYFMRREARVKSMPYHRFAQPHHRDGRSLTQLGYVNGGGMGCRVYSTEGFACTQRASGEGPGGTSGLYDVGGDITRLTVREVARVQQFEDSVVMDEDEGVARRQLGVTAPVGMVRAVGLAIGQYLAVAGLAAPGPTEAPASLEVLAEGDPAVGWRLDGERLALARHETRMIAWQATDAAAQAASTVAAFFGPAGRVALMWHTLTGWQRVHVHHAVRRLRWRQWLRLQRAKGDRAVLAMAASGASVAVVTAAAASVTQVLASEEGRGMGSSGPVALLWWNWPSYMQQELRDGFELPFDQLPAPFQGDNYESANCDKVYQEFTRMLELGYMVGPFQEESGEVYLVSSISAVPKKNSTKLRVVTDMTASGLNEAMTAPRFMLPSVEDVAAGSYGGCWWIVTDLADGFYCQLLHEASQRFLGVRNPENGRLYRYARLPMGLAMSPHNFSRKVAVMVQEALARFPEFHPVRYVINDTDPHMPRVYGVNAAGRPVASLAYYVDDGIITAPTREAGKAAYRRLAWFLESELGLRLNRAKTVGPAQAVPFLGLALDSVGSDVGGACTRLPPARRQHCRDIVRDFMQQHAGRGTANRRTLASVAGELMFASRAVAAGRTFLHRLYACQHETGSARRGDPHDYDRSVALTKGAWRDLAWWRDCLASSACVAKWKTRTFALQRLWTDASAHGYCDTLEVPAKDDLPAMQFGYGQWHGEQAAFSSNWHELATIVMSVAHRLAELRGSVVHYVTDNTTACAAVNHGVAKSTQLMSLIRELRLLQARGDIAIEAFHMSGKLIIAQGSDGGSRQLPYLGQLGANPVPHATFDPTAWPCFHLHGELKTSAQWYRARPGVLDMSDCSAWADMGEVAGRDTYWHLRPRHVATVLRWLLDAQLRRPATTAFTVVVPLVNQRTWRKYLKHFRRQKRFLLDVPGVGRVAHWLLRYEAGDALLGKTPERACEHWDEATGRWADWGGME